MNEPPAETYTLLPDSRENLVASQKPNHRGIDWVSYIPLRNFVLGIKLEYVKLVKITFETPRVNVKEVAMFLLYLFCDWKRFTREYLNKILFS